MDARCFAAAFAEAYGAALPTVDWSRYRHATDRGIVEEALEQLGLAGDATRLARMQEHFVAGLRQALPPAPELAVAGAPRLLAHLVAAGVPVALATGAWRCSAREKLARAGLERFALPLATSDEDADRLAIVQRAVTLAGGAVPGERVVYVGDGPWDLATARRGGYGFVGVDTRADGRLVAGGAPFVFRDFTDLGAVMHALESA